MKGEGRLKNEKGGIKEKFPFITVAFNFTYMYTCMYGWLIIKRATPWRKYRKEWSYEIV